MELNWVSSSAPRMLAGEANGGGTSGEDSVATAAACRMRTCGDGGAVCKSTACVAAAFAAVAAALPGSWTDEECAARRAWADAGGTAVVADAAAAVAGESMAVAGW